MSRVTRDYAQPDQDDVPTAAQAAELVASYLRNHQDQREVELVVRDGGGTEALRVPRPAVVLLQSILRAMAAGRSVSVVPADAELTTQQSADLLGVSRPFLIGLLQAGEIEYRLVGTHRRVKASSLMEYRKTDDERRGRAADELTALTQEMGLD